MATRNGPRLVVVALGVLAEGLTPLGLIDSLPRSASSRRRSPRREPGRTRTAGRTAITPSR